MSKKIIPIIIVIVIVVVVALAWQFAKKTDSNNQEKITANINQGQILPPNPADDQTDDGMIDNIAFSLSGNLVDVSGGNATGVAQAGINEGVYSALATFENLPDPEDDFFYEGWVVRKSPLSVISSGKADKVGDGYVNVFNSEIDLLDHDFYVLTLEPDDGDPAPAVHILEGTMKKINDGIATPEESQVKTFNLTGANFAFSQEEIRVNKGDRVKIVFTSTEGFHDWVVDEFNAATARVNQGGTTSVEFVANKTGTFEYYCSVGTHRLLGMKGNLIVE